MASTEVAPSRDQQDTVVEIDGDRLHRVGARPGLREYLVRLWDYRQFVFYDSRARVVTGTRRDRLGSAWLILNPVFNALTFYLIFGLLLRTSRGIDNFVGYLIIGVFIFQVSAGSITTGARSVQSNRALLQSFAFPRITMPVAASVREALTAVPLVLAMLLMIVVIPPFEQPTWRWLLILPALALQWMFNFGVGLVLARVITRVHDISHVIPFALRGWMYASAVFYSFDRMVDDPALLAVLKANPLYCVLDILRDSILYARTPPLTSWANLTIWSLAALLIGVLFFWHGEESYGRD
ncbi:phosphate ABC transporter permease [Tersicoccus phoenicis]|uniref:Transport permease protein n=1 Tax=Tersicoccus phoenicis TaxID=554083 RepID=A0A1R1LAG6_9MICC|nr:ABC transporter permease [Tersicoccus phoenicis]OMH24531.1 phosphate ABC transporter permease [Tersicoccus phoenicis]